MARDFELHMKPSFHPSTRGLGAPEHAIEDIGGGLICERNVSVSLRDGVSILLDVYRPVADAEYPVLISWAPYGKHSPITFEAFTSAGVPPGAVSNYAAFEGPDPLYWCAHGYVVINVDARGAWYSGGDQEYFCSNEGQDGYDVVEWAAIQPWSNGKVGLSGVSYLAVSQWHTAATMPPHLAAINPWEGWTDPYRELAFHGGIPDSWFYPFFQSCSDVGCASGEDLLRLRAEHPFFDDYWKDKVAPLENITVPAYVVAGWADHSLHTRGTIEGFKRISSKDKWLELHARKKWAHYYDGASLDRQRQFFDHFLKGTAPRPDWPPVSLEVRDTAKPNDFRAEQNWPLERTTYRKLYLDASNAKLCDTAPSTAATADYVSEGEPGSDGTLVFDYQFDKDTEITGYMKLHAVMSTDTGDDMDIFVGVRKFDREGREVPFIFASQYEDGIVAIGWLRASHRELDEKRSTDAQPVLLHDREQRLAPGVPVPVDIEIWPSSTLFRAGERLQLVIQGSDINKYPIPQIASRHEELRNAGRHSVHTGDGRDSYLLVPVVS